jgi:hypothetical protein
MWMKRNLTGSKIAISAPETGGTCRSAIRDSYSLWGCLVYNTTPRASISEVLLAFFRWQVAEGAILRHCHALSRNTEWLALPAGQALQVMNGLIDCIALFVQFGQYSPQIHIKSSQKREPSVLTQFPFCPVVLDRSDASPL